LKVEEVPNVGSVGAAVKGLGAGVGLAVGDTEGMGVGSSALLGPGVGGELGCPDRQQPVTDATPPPRFTDNPTPHEQGFKVNLPSHQKPGGHMLQTGTKSSSASYAGWFILVPERYMPGLQTNPE